MRQARPLGLTADGESLLLVTDDGEYITVPADARLRAAISGQQARLGQLEIDMSSQLTPREIQTRIRSGESLEQVAKAAGVPMEKVEPFASPVLAERAHMAQVALNSPIRRAGESSNHRQLRAVVNERLASRGVDGETVAWDAWRNHDRKWTVVGVYESGKASRRAEFRFDAQGRYSVADSEDAKWLIGESSTSRGPRPPKAEASVDPDNEPTVDFNDEFALVHAVGAETPEPPAVPQGLAEDSASAGRLEQSDEGVMDIVDDEDRSQLDALYDMFHAMNEDSVEIYSGLREEATAPEPPASPPAAAVAAEETAPHSTDKAVASEEEAPSPPESEQGTTSGSASPKPAGGVKKTAQARKPAVGTRKRAEAKPVASRSKKPSGQKAGAAPAKSKAPQQSPKPVKPPQQQARPTTEEPENQDTKPVIKKRRGRASVPSWDEIMFGGSGD